MALAAHLLKSMRRASPLAQYVLIQLAKALLHHLLEMLLTTLAPAHSVLISSVRKHPDVDLEHHALTGADSSARLAQVRLRGSVSSQYLTALLMAAPLASGGPHTDVVIADELVSQPYVSMTVGLMKQFGVEVRSSEKHESPARQNKFA